MNDPNENLINDFVHGTGSFTDLDNLVDPRDLTSIKYYQSAAKELFSRAQAEESFTETNRLTAIAHSHLRRIDIILNKYGL